MTGLLALLALFFCSPAFSQTKVTPNEMTGVVQSTATGYYGLYVASATWAANGGGSGDAVLASTQTFTGANTFAGNATFTSSPTFRGGLAKGMMLQYVEYRTADYAALTSIIPYDDSVPKSSSGTAWIEIAITPKSATTILLIEMGGHQGGSAGTTIVNALFKDSDTYAISAGAYYNSSGDTIAENTILKHRMVSGTTNPITFKWRAGPASAVTVYMNGYAAARRFGGVASCYISVTEIQD